MGGIYGCGSKEVLIIPAPLVSVLFFVVSLLFVHFLMFFVLV